MAYSKLQDFCRDEYNRGLSTATDTHGAIELQEMKQKFYMMLEDLLGFFRLAAASGAQDKVYAPLAVAAQLLLNEQVRSSFLFPDYTIIIPEVYTQACTIIIQEIGLLSRFIPGKSRSSPNDQGTSFLGS